MNIEGTRMMVELAKKMPNLKAFVHVSTAYSHCHLEVPLSRVFIYSEISKLRAYIFLQLYM
jgi:fatty acyl-CoA reductase